MGVLRYMGMHYHMMGYPSIWESVSIYWGASVYGDSPPHASCQNVGVPQYVALRSHILDTPSIFGMPSQMLGRPQYLEMHLQIRGMRVGVLVLHDEATTRGIQILCG